MTIPEEHSDQITDAQISYTEGNFVHAEGLFKDARTGEGDLGDLRAIRGESSAKLKQGDFLSALELARQGHCLSESIYENASNDPEANHNALRENSQSKTILGRTLLFGAVTTELQGDRDMANLEAEESLDLLNDAHIITYNIGRDGKIDQYFFNNVGILGLATGLYGNKATARRLSALGFRYGWQSESSKADNTANISLKYQLNAAGRAVVRGTGAVVVSRLTSGDGKDGRQRDLALNITKKLIV